MKFVNSFTQYADGIGQVESARYFGINSKSEGYFFIGTFQASQKHNLPYENKEGDLCRNLYGKQVIMECNEAFQKFKNENDK